MDVVIPLTAFYLPLPLNNPPPPPTHTQLNAFLAKKKEDERTAAFIKKKTCENGTMYHCDWDGTRTCPARGG